jgi:tetratricopeptide (TPR) repeat protein
MQHLRQALDQRALNAAAIRAERGEVARTRLDYVKAADHFRAAAELLPAERRDERAGYLHRQAVALYDQGTEFGDNDSLQRSIAVWTEVVALRPRMEVPLDWAAAQNNLGNALSTLGERESGTAHLDEAVTAYREALKEYTRERVPLQWAAAQNNLGNALTTLGERESGTGRLDEAVTAYREALKEYTRERVPLQWATTQNNLGNALKALGERENGTARLDEAVTAYREALKEVTRERVPLQWAATQNNLGTALQTLGARGSGTPDAGRGLLDEAVTAYREGPQGVHPRARPARLGRDPEQPRQRASHARRAGERNS